MKKTLMARSEAGGRKETRGRTVPRYTALEREEKFVPVTDRGVRYYGGDQAWFTTQVRRYGGCGTVAAANIAAYDRLGNKRACGKGEYCRRMEEMYRFVRPFKLPFVPEDAKPLHGFGWSLGVWPAGRFIRGMERYGRAAGNPYRTVRYKKRAERPETFIQRALAADRPVVLLIGNASRLKGIRVEYPDGSFFYQKSFARHWVVITAMKRERSGTKIKVSTWGGFAWLSLSECFHTLFLPSRMFCFLYHKKSLL